ncbi:MAG: JDVT-CTERM system glutamic-type intramembrane protease [Planctomycetota bacterium]
MTDDQLLWLSNGLTIGLLTGCVILWLRFFRQPSAERSAFLAPRKRIQSPLGLVDVGMMFLMWAVGISAAIELAGRETVGSPRTVAIVGITQLMMTVLTLGVIAFRYGPSSRIIGLRLPGILNDVQLGTIVFLMAVPPILLLQALLVQLIPYEHQSLDMLNNRQGMYTAWFSAVLVAPVCEEIFFRGMLQGWLQRIDLKQWFAAPQEGGSGGPPFEVIGGGFRHINGDPIEMPKEREGLYFTTGRYIPKLVTRDSAHVWLPITIASAFFASMHLGQGPAPIPLFLLSLVLGYVYHRTHSMIACITIHMLLNAFSMAVGTLQVLRENGAGVAMP